MTNGIKNKIVTSVYSLNYINERGSAVYKAFDLLTKTIRNILFDEYEYVIYTDKATFEKYNLGKVFNESNITIKLHELNSDFYKNVVNPCRLKKISEGHIWDRIHSVDNYVEVMYNKMYFLTEESKNFDGNVLWIDAGLFGTSCGNDWRDKMNEIAHSKKFLDKTFEKIDSHGYIALKGLNIVSNYEEKDHLNKMFDTSLFIVPGGLFGGRSELNLQYFSNYVDVISKMISERNFYTSDQEVLWILLNKQSEIKFFEFEDWNDLQRGILKIMDLYDDTKYQTTQTYDIEIAELQIKQIEMKKRTDREILNEILQVKNRDLDRVDLSKFDDTINKMTSFALYFKDLSGSHHYRLLSYISNLLYNEDVYDIGADNGCSGLALSDNETINVFSYDIVYREEISLINRNNFQFFIENILDTSPEKLNTTRFIMLDTFHDGTFEKVFYEFLLSTNYKGLLFLDDIHLNDEMEYFWNSITQEKYDLTKIGHSTGSGIVIFE
jgi:hypothetical protein